MVTMSYSQIISYLFLILLHLTHHIFQYYKYHYQYAILLKWNYAYFYDQKPSCVSMQKQVKVFLYYVFFIFRAVFICWFTPRLSKFNASRTWIKKPWIPCWISSLLHCLCIIKLYFLLFCRFETVGLSKE